MSQTFSTRERIIAAKELCADAVGHVQVGTGFLESLADDLLRLPTPELEALRAELAPLYPEPTA